MIFVTRSTPIYEQEQKLVELRRSKGPFDRAVRALTTNIRESYESMVLENVSSSESIEQQLWQLHYNFIQEFRARLGKLKAAAVAAANVPNKKKAVESRISNVSGVSTSVFLMKRRVSTMGSLPSSGLSMDSLESFLLPATELISRSFLRSCFEKRNFCSLKTTR